MPATAVPANDTPLPSTPLGEVRPLSGSRVADRPADLPARSVADPSHRLFALDVLRGAAVILVIVRHWPGFPVGLGPFRYVSEVGWTGVDLFFVLSGFLISGLLFKEWDRTGSIDLRRFWLRRGFKIWPAYFAAFGVAMTLRCVPILRDRGIGGVVAEWKNFLPSVLFVQNYFPQDRRWPYTWSVAVEEHFYLVLPILLLALGRVRARDQGPNAQATRLAADPPFPFLPAVVLLVCTVALLLRVLAVRASAGWRDVYYPTHLRADALAFGVMIGYWHRYFPVRFGHVCRMWPLLLAAVLLSLLVPALYPLTTSGVTITVGFTLLYLAYGGLVALAARYPGFGRSVAPMRWAAAIGRYSYTIYLAHGAMEILPRYGRSIALAGRLGGVWAQRALFVGLAAIGGVALAWLVERPALRLRERWLPARRLGIPHPSDNLLSPSPQSAAGPTEVNG